MLSMPRSKPLVILICWLIQEAAQVCQSCASRLQSILW